MNKQAKKIGMTLSSFGNPHGLPNYRNSSNPYDLALLISVCLKIPLFCKIVATQSISIWVTSLGNKK
jgi:D-alanyl-D-alanine carboxypeptidase